MRALCLFGSSLLIAVSVAGFGCGGNGGGGAAAGEEGGACYPNNTCNTPLVCTLPSKLCVQTSTGTAGTGGGTAGTTGAGGTTGVAGTTGTGGTTATTGTGGTAGTTGAGGTLSTAGTTGTGGTLATGGTTGTAGTTGTGARGGSGGAGGPGSAGTTGAAGAAGTTGSGGTSSQTMRFTLNIDLMVVVVSPGGGAPKPGPVTSVPAGITCGGSFITTATDGDCEESYFFGTSVVLTAQGTSVVNFTAWTGDCSGTNPVITVAMTGHRNCTAVFTQIN